ncbi:MAG: ACT domain-containing protein [Nocardioidaceae bacterium]|nr:ACT domain-containing protein [Nocardioidaceae bacterium]MCL2614854.1 ACT domain-containing protein [Nocardioidaceae bacterium]
MSATFSLARYPETLAVVRLAPGAEVPEWAESSSLFSITATAAETSLICAGRNVPRKIPHQKPFTAFCVTDELAFDQVGVLVTLLGPLAEAGIPIMTVSTYDTDWILVPTAEADRAEEAWRRTGHQVAPAVPSHLS